MKDLSRGLLACLVCVLFFLVVWPSGVWAEEVAPTDGSSSLLSSPTVITNAELLVGGQHALAEEARRANPEAVAEREASRTRFAGLGGREAVVLAEKTFGINHPSWTPAQDEGTGRITEYLSETSAIETLPDGKHLVVTSTVPLRSDIGSGHAAPTSLALQDRGSSYEPANPLVPVSISKDASSGVSFPLGISVAPAEAASPGSSELAGNSVVYPNIAHDTDFIVEPLPSGVEASWQLRSQNSPQDNSLVFTLPAGASLRINPEMSNEAEVVEEGSRLLLIPPAFAQEADGSSLPVSYSVSGDTLTTHVDLSGSVAFPVLVDPIVESGFGSYGVGTWTGWYSYDNCGTGCYGVFEHEDQLITLIAPSTWPAGYWGEWYIYAPGNDSSIERVDLTGVAHGFEEGSNMWAEIGYSSGTHPVWTFNGLGGAQGESPYFSNAVFEHRGMAFCAQGAGGKDGGEQPLCNENYGGEYFRFGNETRGWTSEYNFTEISGAVVRFLDTTPPYQVRLWGLKNTWTRSAEYPIEAQDEGMGIAAFSVEIPPGHLNEAGQPFFAQNVSCPSGGIDGCPRSETSKPINFSGLGTGIYTLGVYAYDEAGNVREEEVGSEDQEDLGSKVDPKLYLDQTPPKMSPLSGSLAEANGGVIGSGNYTLNFSAEDGSTSAPQSGVHEFLVYVDGHLAYDDPTTVCPEPHGIPSSSCFDFSGNWTMEGQDYGAGTHTITVTAIDWAGNEASETIHVTVNESPYETAGPGSVNLRTGDYKLDATDAAVASADGELMVSRSYNSRELTAGANGPLGPQWSLSLPDSSADAVWQSLQTLSNGSVQVTAATGERIVFLANGSSGYVSPAGYQTDTLTEPSKSPAEYRLTNAAGDATIFTRASTGTEEQPLFVPSGVVQATGAGGLNKMTYLFTKTTEGIIEPTAIIAPYASSEKCSERIEKKEELVNGCRALTFTYSVETKAKGENSGEWGEYKGRLAEVYLEAWNTTTGKITSTPVVEYSYDALGRLRAVWNPETSLKIVYGYDTEGHVTALTEPGLETWVFTYGTVAGDSNTGRLIKVTQSPAASKLWGGQAPKDTEAPKLSGTAVVGVTMGVSHGSWSNEPVTYSYQWEDCNTEGKACTPILGATNANYTVASSDVGHTLVAQVSAINGGGTVTIASAASATAASSGTKTEGEHYNPAPGTTVEYHVPLSGAGLPTMIKTEVEKWDQKADIPAEATAIFPPDKATDWPAKEYVQATIYYEDSNERIVNILDSTGGISTTEYNSHNNIIRVLSADDRAIALKESKPAEVAEKLSTNSTYNSEGTELEETLGPEHKVKLGSGSEVEARKQVKYAYEEDAPAGGPYDLVTKTTEDALTSSGKEEDVRTVSDSYAGQKGLGWKLHTPTSTSTDPSALDLTHATTYSETTGAPIETKMPGGTVETVYPPVYAGSFGGSGSGSGQFKNPAQAAVDGSGNIWITDTDNNRIEKFNGSGTYLASYGTTGSGNDQFKEPWGIAISQSSGDVYVTDRGNNRIEELNASGEYVTNFGTEGSGKLAEPMGVSIDPSGDVWVADKGHNRVVEYSATGSVVREIGSAGSGNGQFNAPTGVTVSEGSIYVLDTGNDRVEQFSLSGKYLSQFGHEGTGSGEFKEPYGIATNPTTGDLYVSDSGDWREEEFSPAGRFLAEWSVWSESHELYPGLGLAINSTGELYIVNQESAKVSEWTEPEAGGANLAYNDDFGSYGSGEGQFLLPTFSAIDGHGNIWVTDYYKDDIQEFSSKGGFIAAYGKEGSGNGQFSNPTGIAINQSTGDVYISDNGNNRVEELSPSGEFIRTFGTTGAGQLSSPSGLTIDSSGDVWVADYANDRVVEFSSTGSYIAAYGSKGSGNDQFDGPADVVFSGSNLYVTDRGNHRVQELSSTGIYIRQFGKEGKDSGELYTPEGIAADAEGNLYVTDEDGNRIEEFSPTGGFKASFGSHGSEEGQVDEPIGISISAAGNMYVVDAENHRIDMWALAYQQAHDSQIIYYTPSTEASVAACQNHPEWANLPCQTQPAHQPEVSGMPELPVTTFTYNIWDEPETTKSTSGTATRTETDTYDSAGRLTSKETTSTTGASLPKISYQYSTETGLLTKQSTGSGSEEKKITTEYNKLGQMTSYTDADGATTTYEYEKEGDYRLTKTTDSKGSQTLKYGETTGTVKELVDSTAGTFTASYDVEGNIVSENLPNGMTETTTRNTVGEPTSLEYTKTTHCTENCKWFTDTVVPSIHGQWASQTSTLSSENYTYDEAGRLTQVQDTPAGKGCVTRIYSLDADGNRTSLTTRAPGTGGACATEGGEIEKHQYDTADRLIDTGTEYNPFGDITTLPAADAGGSKLVSSYYTDGQLASQEQAGQTIGYNLDPARRTREIVSTGKRTSDMIDHYDGPGTSPSWTSYTSGEWTRNIPGISGTLEAVQQNTETPVLQIANLHGDIIGTVPDNETATKLSSTQDTTEYGVPTTTEPPKYSWLGAGEFPTELSSGVIAMGARSYIPQLGRFLQPDPQPGGSANAYAYTHGNPLNETDPSGEWTLNETSGGLSAVGTGEGEKLTGGTGIAAGAITPAPVNTQIEEAFDANPPWDQTTAGNEEYEEYEEEWEEEGEYENVAYHPGGKEGYAEAHVGSAVLEEKLVQSLGGEEGGGGSGTTTRSSTIRCKTGVEGPCVRDAQSCFGHSHEMCVEYVGLFGEIVSGISKAAKGGWKVIKHAAHNVWNWVKSHASLARTISCGISGGGAGVLAGVGASAFTDNLYIGGSIGAAVASGVTYACEHQNHGF